MTKTLKQKFEFYFPDLSETTHKLMIETVKDWLQQKQDYINRHYPKNDAYWNGRRDSFTDLLEDLERG